MCVPRFLAICSSHEASLAVDNCCSSAVDVTLHLIRPQIAHHQHQTTIGPMPGPPSCPQRTPWPMQPLGSEKPIPVSMAQLQEFLAISLSVYHSLQQEGLPIDKQQQILSSCAAPVPAAAVPRQHTSCAGRHRRSKAAGQEALGVHHPSHLLLEFRAQNCRISRGFAASAIATAAAGTATTAICRPPTPGTAVSQFSVVLVPRLSVTF